MSSLPARRRLGARVALAALTVAASAAASTGLFLGCSSDSEPFGDSGFGDANPSGDASTAASLVVLHASPDAPDFRLCFGFGSTMSDELPSPGDPTRPMPRTNFPGVPVGGAAIIQAPGGASVVPHLIWAKELSFDERRTKTCRELFCGSGPTCLVKNASYRELPAVTLSAGRTSALLVTGCLPLDDDESANAARCGDDYDPVRGNLRASVVSLPPTSDSGSLQFFHLAPALRGAEVELRYGSLGAPYARAVPLLGPAFYLGAGEAAFSPPSGTDLGAYEQNGFFVVARDRVTSEAGTPETDAGDAGDGGASPNDAGTGEAGVPDRPGTLYTFSLADVQRASAPIVVPPELFDGGVSYVLALVGEPRAGQGVPVSSADAGDAGDTGARDASSSVADGAAPDLGRLHLLAVPLP